MDGCLRANQWTIELRAIVVMPDHAHMIFTPLVDIEKSEVFSLARITKAIKGTSAHLINRQVEELDGFSKRSLLIECCGFQRNSKTRLLQLGKSRKKGISVIASRISLVMGGAYTGAELRSARQMRTSAPAC